MLRSVHEKCSYTSINWERDNAGDQGGVNENDSSFLAVI